MRNHLRDLRSKRGWTQDQVAAAVRVDRTAYSRMETGKRIPGLETALLLARLYGCPVEEIFIVDRNPENISPGSALSGI